MRKIFSIFAAMLVAVAVSADPVILPATLDVSNVSFRSEGMPDFVIEEGQDYAGTYFDMGAHDSANDTLLYAEWDVTIEPIKYNLAVEVYNTNSWRVQLYLLNQEGDTLKSLRYKGSSGQKGQYTIGSLDLSDLEAGDYKVRAHAATAWSAMKLKDVIFEADYQGVNVDMPGTLLPAYAVLSDGASVTNNAIAFAPSTAPGESAYWNVTFAEAGSYNVSIDITASNGHTYSVSLYPAEGSLLLAQVSENQSWDTGVKELGAIDVPEAGTYSVVLKNATQWSEAVLNSITIAAPASTKYYLKNNWDGAGWTWKEMSPKDNGSGTYYILDSVVFGGTGVNVNTEIMDETATWIPIENFVDMDDEDGLTIGALDTVVFYYVPSQSDVISYNIIGKYVDPISEHTYTVAGSSVAVFGTQWDKTNTANDMIKDEMGIYRFEKTEVTLAAGTISFKVVKDHDWDKGAYPSDNYDLNIPEAGIYTISVTFDPSTGTVGAEATKTGSAEVVPEVKLHGNFTGTWADTNPFITNPGKTMAQLSLDLVAGTYEFGMKFDGTWKANGATITREISQTTMSTGSGNMHIVADFAGLYIFSYVFENESLTVTYPNEPGEGIDNTNANVQSVKRLENGILVIEKNGHTYNAMGIRIR